MVEREIHVLDQEDDRRRQLQKARRSLEARPEELCPYPAEDAPVGRSDPGLGRPPAGRRPREAPARHSRAGATPPRAGAGGRADCAAPGERARWGGRGAGGASGGAQGRGEVGWRGVGGVLGEPGAGRARGPWHARADGPRAPEAERRGSVKGGGEVVWSVFPLWRTNNPGQRGGSTVQPFNRVGGAGEARGGSERGSPAPLIPSPLPPPRVLADAARRAGPRDARRTCPRPSPARPPTRSRPARAPRAPTPAPARCPGPARVWGEPLAPGGWGTKGENQHAEPGQVRRACTPGS